MSLAPEKPWAGYRLIVKHAIKTRCGGGRSFIFQTQTPVRKNHIEAFEKAGFVTLPHYVKSGLFYIQRGGLVATASFGSTKIQVRCSNSSADIIAKFEQILDELTGVPSQK